MITVRSMKTKKAPNPGPGSFRSLALQLVQLSIIVGIILLLHFTELIQSKATLIYTAYLQTVCVLQIRGSYKIENNKMGFILYQFQTISK